MRYRNPTDHVAVLPEHRADDGHLLPTVAVDPGGEVDWPIPIASFEPVPDSSAAERPAGAGRKNAALAVAGTADVDAGASR